MFYKNVECECRLALSPQMATITTNRYCSDPSLTPRTTRKYNFGEYTYFLKIKQQNWPLTVLRTLRTLKDCTGAIFPVQMSLYSKNLQ